MRNGKGQFQKGHSGNPAGRPKRADEQFLVDLWVDAGQEQFSIAVKNGERWALKLLVDKLYAAPRIGETDHSSPITLVVSKAGAEKYGLVAT